MEQDILEWDEENEEWVECSERTMKIIEIFEEFGDDSYPFFEEEGVK